MIKRRHIGNIYKELDKKFNNIVIVPNKFRNKVNKKALDTHGIPAQTYVWMEECSELAQAFSKMIRYKTNKDKDNLIEEMADVLICIEMAMKAYDISHKELYDMMLRKQQRNYERMLKDETK